MFVKIGDFIKFKGFLVEFSEKRRSSENQKPPENRQKSGLSEPRLYNAPSLHTVECKCKCNFGQILSNKLKAACNPVGLHAVYLEVPQKEVGERSSITLMAVVL